MLTVSELAARVAAMWDELGDLEDARDRLWGALAGGYDAEIEAAILRIEAGLGSKYDVYRLALLDYEAACDARDHGGEVA